MADLAKGKLSQGYDKFECIQSSTTHTDSVDRVIVFRMFWGADSRSVGMRVSQVTK